MLMSGKNRRTSSWVRAYSNLERHARVPSTKELALGLALMNPVSPMTSGAPSQIEQPSHPVGWENYRDVAMGAADKHGIPEDMFLRLLQVENPSGDPSAVNPSSGATGLGQFMPETAKSFSIDPNNPHTSIDAAAKYLAELYGEFRNWEHAVMAYNFGPGNVRHWIESGSVIEDLPKETRAYVSRINPA